jgi:murein DD-endopeptidase MepM/ murein hydrolase activator NlpD
MGEHDAEHPATASPESDGRDVAWLQLPTVAPYTSGHPLVGEAPPAEELTDTPAKVAAQVAPAPASIQGTGEYGAGPRAVPSLPRETERFLAVHAAEFAPPPGSERVPAVRGEVRTDARSPVVFIRGSSVSMGEPFVKRRARPLGMRLAMYLAIACTVISALFGVSAVSGSDPTATIQSLYKTVSRSAASSTAVGYLWYVAQAGDTVEGIAERFHVQAGGIFEINNMRADQEVQLGQKYKIPTDPFYGQTYRPADPIVQGNGSTTFGNDWWNSYAGTPIRGQLCSPSGPRPTDYEMVAPNPGSNWVRGYTWYHLGIDSAGPYGEPIVAAQRGIVIWAGWTNLGYGWSVVISHCNHVSTLYGHMANKPLVKAGQNVVAGQPVGLEGSTGWSTGPHLHFSLFWDNQYVDPLPYYGNSEANFLRPCNCYTPA